MLVHAGAPKVHIDAADVPLCVALFPGMDSPSQPAAAVGFPDWHVPCLKKRCHVTTCIFFERFLFLAIASELRESNDML